MRPYRVLINPNASLWIQMSPNEFLSVLIRPYGF